MAYKLICMLLAFIAVTHGAVKVPVTIYYESLCPDSAKFINEQVYPALKAGLKDHLEITWVPFGKSKFHTQGSEVQFECHHGVNECYGNKVHACAIEHIQASSYQVELTRESMILEFINCMMRVGKNFPDNVYPGERCARDNQISIWENLQQCANGTEGSQLLKHHGETTMQFQNPLLSVPTVVFKQQYDADVNTRAQSNFLGTACKYVSQPQLDVCRLPNTGAAVSISYVPLLGALSFFVFSALSRLF